LIRIACPGYRDVDRVTAVRQLRCRKVNELCGIKVWRLGTGRYTIDNVISSWKASGLIDVQNSAINPRFRPLEGEGEERSSGWGGRVGVIVEIRVGIMRPVALIFVVQRGTLVVKNFISNILPPE